jgi:hypothetical protein
MAGRPLTRARAAARMKQQRGERLTEEEERILDSKWVKPHPKTADLDPTGAKSGISDRAMAEASEFVDKNPQLKALLEERLVPEPDDAPFSHQAVQLLAQAGTPETEIARLLGLEVKALKAEAGAALELGNTQHRVKLRLAQYRAAMVGDRTLLVWLGKQSLGQMDRAATEITGRDGKPIEMQEAANDVRGKLTRLLAQVQSAEVIPPAMRPALPDALDTPA